MTLYYSSIKKYHQQHLGTKVKVTQKKEIKNLMFFQIFIIPIFRINYRNSVFLSLLVLIMYPKILFKDLKTHG